MRAKRRYVKFYYRASPVVEKGMVSPQAGRARRYTFFHYRASPLHCHIRIFLVYFLVLAPACRQAGV